MISLILSAMVGIFFTKLWDCISVKRIEYRYLHFVIFGILIFISKIYSFLENLNEKPLLFVYLEKTLHDFNDNNSLQIILIAVVYFGILMVYRYSEGFLKFPRYSSMIRKFTSNVREGGCVSIAAGDMDFFGNVAIKDFQISNLMDENEEYLQLLELCKNHVRLEFLCRHGLKSKLLNSVIRGTISPELIYSQYRNSKKLNDVTFQQLLRIGKIASDCKYSVDIRFYNTESDDKQFRGRFIDDAGIIYRKEKELSSIRFRKKETFPFFQIYTKKEDLYSVNKLTSQELTYFKDMFKTKWNACNKNKSLKIVSFCESLYHYANKDLPRFHMALIYATSYEIARKKETRKEFPPFGVMYLAAAVRKELNWDVKLISVDNNTPAEKLNWSQYDAIGFSIISSYSYDILKRSYELSQKKIGAIIFAGGYQAEKFSSNVFKDFNAQIIFKGEGENSIRNFCQHYESRDFSKIPGIIYRGNDQNICATEGPRTVEINSVDPPARDYLPTEDIVMTDRLAGTELKMVHILFSRGCVHKCHYCAANQENTIKEIRYRDKESIYLELKSLIGTFQIEGFSIIDDCFLTDQKKAIEICDYIADKNLNLKWSLAARVDDINNDVLSSLKRSGCIEIKFGVETGSNDLLKKMNKGVTVADAEKAITMTKSYGIHVKLFIITGFPFETNETHQETKDFLNRMKKYIDRVSLLRYTPLAGSYIYNQPEKFGIKKSALTSRNFNKTNLYRTSYDWWVDPKRHGDCERWYNDMKQYIDGIWGES